MILDGVAIIVSPWSHWWKPGRPRYAVTAARIMWPIFLTAPGTNPAGVKMTWSAVAHGCSKGCPRKRWPKRKILSSSGLLPFHSLQWMKHIVFRNGAMISPRIPQAERNDRHDAILGVPIIGLTATATPKCRAIFKNLVCATRRSSYLVQPTEPVLRDPAEDQCRMKPTKALCGLSSYIK